MGLRMRRRRRAGKALEEEVLEVEPEGDPGQQAVDPAVTTGGEDTVHVDQLSQAGTGSECRLSLAPSTGAGGAADDPNPVPECVKKMSVNQNTGETILHKAARLGYEDVAKYCAETKYVDLDARDHAGYTAMHECCSQGHLAVASYLIGGGASVNLQSCDGMRPLHDAVENGLMEMVRMLLSCGADPRLATYGGKTVLGLTNGKEMTDYLNGYFQDLNGCKQHQPELAWLFQGSSTMEDREEEEETGFDVFADPAGDDSEGAVAGGTDDPEFDFSDQPLIQTYFIALDPVKGACNYILVADLRTSLALTQEELEERHPDLQVVKVAVEEITSSLQCLSPDGVRQLEACQDSTGHVTMVEQTDGLRRLGGVTSERLSQMRALGEEEEEKDAAESYNWDEQYQRTTSDYNIAGEAPATIDKDALYRALFAHGDDDDGVVDGYDTVTDTEDGGGVTQCSNQRRGHLVHQSTFQPIDAAATTTTVDNTTTATAAHHTEPSESQPGSPQTDDNNPATLVITQVCSLSAANSPHTQHFS